MNVVHAPTRHSRSWLAAALVGAVGLVLTGLLVAATVVEARHSHDSALEADGHAVTQAFVETIDSVADHLVAIKGLFVSSDLVTPGEFTSFVDELGLPDGAAAVGFAARVHETPDALFQVHPGFPRSDNAPVFTLDSEMKPLPLEPASHHDILIFTAPAGEFDDMVGLDLSSVSPASEVIRYAMAGDALLATPPFEPLMGFEGTEFLVFQRVTNTGGGPTGWAVALLDLDRMVADGLAGRLVPAERISVSELGAPAVDGGWVDTLSGFGRQWQIEVIPEEAFAVVTPARIGMVVVGLMVSLGAALLVAARLHAIGTRREIERLEAARVQTDRLLSEISHQLRTPLTAVLGFLGEAASGWQQLPERDRFAMLGLAERGALEMGALVDDLLVRERMVSGASIPVTTEEVDIVDVVRTVAVDLGSTFDVHVSGESGVVLADRHRLSQAIRHIVVAGDRGGSPTEIVVGSEGESDTMVLRVRGVGIAECCRVGIFDLEVVPQRHDHPRPAGADGFGLPVARFLLDAMGGTVSHEPDTDELVVRLPAAAEGVAAA